MGGNEELSSDAYKQMHAIFIRNALVLVTNAVYRKGPNFCPLSLVDIAYQLINAKIAKVAMEIRRETVKISTCTTRKKHN